MTEQSTQIRVLPSSIHLKDYLAVIFRRKLLILLAFVAVVASTIFYVRGMEDIYESYATLVIEESNRLISQAMQTVPGKPLSYYQGILNSRTFQEMVFDSIGMDIFKSNFQNIGREKALEYINSAISLRKTEYSSFLRFNVRAKSRELSYLIAGIGTGIFRAQCEEVASEEARRTVVEIDKQLKLIRTKLENAEREYRSFQEKTGDITGGTSPELKQLQEAYAKDIAQKGVKEANLTAEKRLLARLETKIAPAEKKRSPEYLKLRAQLKELEREKIRLENLGIRMTGMSTIDRDIQEIEKQLIQYKRTEKKLVIDPNEIRQWQRLRKSVLNKEAELELFIRRLETYKRAIDNYKKGNPDMLAQSLELQRLKLARDNYENIYTFLINRAEDERIKSASSKTGIKIVDTARMPEKPIPKNETRYYLLGIILGLALGLGLAFFVEYNDTTIKANDDIERYLQLPVLGTIPHITYSRKEELEIKRKSSRKKGGTSRSQYPRNLLSFKGDDSIITEAYRSLRTNLSYVSPDKPLHTVIVTSSGPSEGKSLTISNLAIANAQMGRKTLLIDTDLRRPILHHLFKLKREPGFTELFTEDASYETSIRPTGHENLFLLTAGLFSPNPAELLASQKLVQHIEYFRNNFDIVFFDTPPVVAVTDATLLGRKVDGLLIVIKSHRTDREIAMRAVQSLTNVGVKIVGTVLNDINLSHRYSSYGYYKYYYHYYKSKSD
ncbi:MAG: polysaccharide biosynthesis tyrosine autokinase [Chitinivibrionales bacterium]|nr:polysaccharide biosynthesis tyrosine autokinase [Chitinivibrionales bacterium]